MVGILVIVQQYTLNDRYYLSKIEGKIQNKTYEENSVILNVFSVYVCIVLIDYTYTMFVRDQQTLAEVLL